VAWPRTTAADDGLRTWANQQAVARAHQLIDARQYVLKSVWNDVQPSAAASTAWA
jgi:hypothetical protein